ncbi:MAG: alpha/beta hydrolase [Bowdeniella nasicola]|nr:alpha/beta hydrolase [Bowdeniella nasicola]
MKTPRLLAWMVIAGFTLAGCVTSAEDIDEQRVNTAPTITPNTAGAPAGLEEFYSQEISWDECDQMWCTRVVVPMDYDNPDGETIEIAVKQLRRSDDAHPALFVNPGGPGGSGVQMMDYINELSSPELQEAYHITGFDPRGVNQSTPVVCEDDRAHDARRARDYDMDDPAQREAAVADAQTYADACAENTGALLGFVDTISAARDLDILRAVVGGTDKLDYLGFSYGTYLGATYADLFAERVGHMVLDGALDPLLTNHELAAGQAEGFDNAIRAYIADCQAGPKCPLRGDVDDGLTQLERLFTSLRNTPLPTDQQGRELTRSLALMGVITPLYNQSSWPALSQALTQAMQEHDGSMLLYFADLMADRNPDGSYETNSDDAFVAINCLDYPVIGQMDDWQREAEELTEISPLFGADLGYGELACSLWAHQSTRERSELHATGSDPIVVIGTTGDPATPYRWSTALASQLDNAYLVTYDGEGHTAYSTDHPCIVSIVDAYFLDDQIPDDNATCPQ